MEALISKRKPNLYNDNRGEKKYYEFTAVVIGEVVFNASVSWICDISGQLCSFLQFSVLDKINRGFAKIEIVV